MYITQDMTVGVHESLPQVLPLQYQLVLSVMRMIFQRGLALENMCLEKTRKKSGKHMQRQEKVRGVH